MWGCLRMRRRRPRRRRGRPLGVAGQTRRERFERHTRWRAGLDDARLVHSAMPLCEELQDFVLSEAGGLGHGVELAAGTTSRGRPCRSLYGCSRWAHVCVDSAGRRSDFDQRRNCKQGLEASLPGLRDGWLTSCPIAVSRGPDISVVCKPAAPARPPGSLKRENRDPLPCAGHHQCCSHGQGGGFPREPASEAGSRFLPLLPSTNRSAPPRGAQEPGAEPGSPEFVAASVQAQDRLAAAHCGAAPAWWRSTARCPPNAARHRWPPLQAQGCEVCYPAWCRESGRCSSAGRPESSSRVRSGGEPTGAPVSLEQIGLLVVRPWPSTRPGAGSGGARAITTPRLRPARDRASHWSSIRSLCRRSRSRP